MKNRLTKAFALLPGLLLVAARPAWACPVCRPKVQAAIYGPHYLATALLVLLPVLLLAASGLGLYFSSRLPLCTPTLPRPLLVPAPCC